MIEVRDVRLALDGDLKAACAKKLRVPVGDVLEAALLRHPAARRETAAGLGVDGAGNFALDQVDLLVAHGNVVNGDGGQQGLGIGMAGIGEQLVRGGPLHALTQIHNHGDYEC